jgi:hypothetical protein
VLALSLTLVLPILNVNKYLFIIIIIIIIITLTITGVVTVHATKEHEGENVWLHQFLTSKTDVGHVSFTAWSLYPTKGPQVPNE